MPTNLYESVAVDGVADVDDVHEEELCELVSVPARLPHPAAGVVLREGGGGVRRLGNCTKKASSCSICMLLK
jgi:hypothetical protein